MKQLSLLLFIILSSAVSFAQFPNSTSVSNNKTIYTVPVLRSGIAFFLPIADTLNNQATIYAGAETIRPQDAGLLPPIIYISNGTYWARENNGGGGGGGTDSIAGGTVTTVPVVGTVINTNIPTAQAINELFFGAQPPTSTLSGGGTFEFTNVPTSTHTLTWSASRQAATTSLLSIVVGSIPQAFSQPSAPGTVNGTQNITVPSNTTNTYYIIVTASDGKSSTSSITIDGKRKIYAGYVTSATPTDADIIAATNSAYVGGQFATSFVQSGTLSTPSSSKYVVFASPLSFGVPTVTINGLDVSYTVTSRTFTNASGYASSYYILVSPFPTAGGLTYSIH